MFIRNHKRQRILNCFFFSSRRRHTSFSRDWSSDVCSSDLDQVRQVEEIEDFQRATDRLKHLVTELESNRAGQTRTIQHLCEKIAIEAAQMRQRALTGNVGTIADVAGTMSVMAGRGGGVLMK